MEDKCEAVVSKAADEEGGSSGRALGCKEVEVVTSR
jgi:hypothetical protein